MATPQQLSANTVPITAPVGAPQPKLKRRPKQVTNPLVQKKTPAERSSAATRAGPPGLVNGHGSGAKPRAANTPRPDEYEDIPIVLTKHAFQENLKYHVIRFLPNISADQQVIDLCDQTQFQRPVRLHRRDPRANNMHQPGNGPTSDVKPAHEPKSADDKERERQAIAKAERQAERERLQADTAPTTKSVQPKKKKFRKHIDQPHTYSDKVEKQDLMSIRYEEKLPWHIEDFEDQQVWRGTYETALSQNHVALTPEQTASGQIYRMIPLEKWYKFTPKGQIPKMLSYEEVEKAMQKGARDPLWLRKNAAEQMMKKAEAGQGPNRSFFARKGERGEQGGVGRIKTEGDDDDAPEAAADIDDIDFNYDEDFADDEEGPELVGQEEQEQAKEVDEKVKREMRDAPVFDIKEEKDFDAEEEAQKLRDIEEKRIARKTQRALMKREKNFAYEQDSEGNPYESETESEDSETERQKEEERKQEEQRGKGAEGHKPHKHDNALHSGASTKGSNTPVPHHKLSKVNGPLRGALKRPGSPNLSEASGNESGAARKKQKKKYTESRLGVPDGANISRTASPANGVNMNGGPNLVASQAQKPVRLNIDDNGRPISPAGASGSDVEMSDGSRGAGVKRTKASKPGSPTASRPGSPGTGAVKKPRLPQPPPQPATLPPISVLQRIIPDTGINIQSFVRIPEIAPVANHSGFEAWFKSVAVLDTTTNTVWAKGRGQPHVDEIIRKQEMKEEKARKKREKEMQAAAAAKAGAGVGAGGVNGAPKA